MTFAETSGSLWINHGKEILASLAVTCLARDSNAPFTRRCGAFMLPWQPSVSHVGGPARKWSALRHQLSAFEACVVRWRTVGCLRRRQHSAERLTQFGSRAYQKIAH